MTGRQLRFLFIVALLTSCQCPAEEIGRGQTSNGRYENSKLGLSFRYPQTWHTGNPDECIYRMAGDATSVALFFASRRNGVKAMVNGKPNFSMTVYADRIRDNMKVKSERDYIANLKRLLSSDPDVIYELGDTSKTTIGSTTFHRFSARHTSSHPSARELGTSEVHLFVKVHKGYAVCFVTQHFSKQKADRSTMAKMLKTVQFK